MHTSCALHQHHVIATSITNSVYLLAIIAMPIDHVCYAYACINFLLMYMMIRL